MERLTTTLRIRERRDYPVVGGLVCVGAGIGTMLMFREGQHVMGVVALMFVLLGAWMALGFGWVELGPDGVRRGCPLGVWRIRWEEVQTVRTDGMTFVLRGPAKHLPLVPMYWRRPEARDGIRLLFIELERRDIPVTADRRASYRLPRNVRIARDSRSVAA